VSAENPSGGGNGGGGGELVLQGQTSDIALYRPPETVLAEAHKAAVALQDVIKNKKDPVMMNGQQYLEYEDWQTVGRFYGITAKVEKVEYVQYGAVRGFSASAVALRSDGAVISQAIADCLSDEPKWSKKAKYEWRDKAEGGGRERVQVGEEDVPLFQLKSMAQTRACSKVLRNVLAWVVVLAGYKATPAEELDASMERGGGGGSSPASSSEPKPSGSGRSEGAQGSSQGAGSQGGQPAASGQPAGKAGLPEGATTIKSVSTKKGENARGPWVKFFIKFEDGRSASTFSKTDGEHAERAKESGAHVIPKIKKEGDFFNLECFEPWPKKEKKEEHPNAHEDPPISGPEKILTMRETNTENGKRWFIQTDKRVLITDKEQHISDAQEARKENMSLTPKVEIIDGKNRLLAWEETIAMHAAEGEAGGEEQAEGPEEPAAEGKAEPAKRTRARKGGAK
jgi:hypothetical protein